MRKHVLTVFLLLIIVIICTNVSFAEDGWVPRIPPYQDDLLDQLRGFWQQAWKFFGF